MLGSLSLIWFGGIVVVSLINNLLLSPGNPEFVTGKLLLVVSLIALPICGAFKVQVIFLLISVGKKLLISPNLSSELNNKYSHAFKILFWSK